MNTTALAALAASIVTSAYVIVRETRAAQRRHDAWVQQQATRADLNRQTLAYLHDVQVETAAAIRTAWFGDEDLAEWERENGWVTK